MSRQILLKIVLIACMVIPAAGCAPGRKASPAAGMANPASLNCEEHGGKVEMRQDASGGVVGICVFPTGLECDEWAFFRGECGANSQATPPASETPAPSQPADETAPGVTPTPETVRSGWKVYRNAKFGFSFEYPADAVLQTDNGDDYMSVVGPLENDEHWPMIFFNHPAGREDYRLPQGTDVKQWLLDHNLVFAQELQPEIQIAGSTAYHARTEGSEQSYAADRYFFAVKGQLYSVVILHTGQENWQVYNHFLHSIHFD